MPRRIQGMWSQLSVIACALGSFGVVGVTLFNPLVWAQTRPAAIFRTLDTPYEHVVQSSKSKNSTVPLLNKASKPPEKPPKALGQVQNTIRVVRSNLTWLDQKISAQTAVINLNRAHLNSLDLEIAKDKAELKAFHARYTIMTTELNQTRKKLSQKLQVFSNEMQFVQQHGAVSYLSVFVGVHSFSDFVSRLFLLVEVGQILGRQVQAVHRIERKEAVVRQNMLSTIQHMTAMTRGLDKQAKILAAQNSADSKQETLLVSLKSKALNQLKESVNEAVNWKKLSKQKPQFLGSLSTHLGSINQTLEDLLAMGMGGPMSRQNLFQSLYPLVKPIAKTFSLPIPLVLAVITEESGGHQAAVSRTGAIGLMQLEPGTAHWLGINPYNPETNVVGGCLYLHQLLQLFNGNLSLALSAYNAGPKYVIQTQKVLPVTATYVSNIESLYQAYRAMVYVPAVPIPVATKKPTPPPSTSALTVPPAFGKLHWTPS